MINWKTLVINFCLTIAVGILWSIGSFYFVLPLHIVLVGGILIGIVSCNQWFMNIDEWGDILDSSGDDSYIYLANDTNNLQAFTFDGTTLALADDDD